MGLKGIAMVLCVTVWQLLVIWVMLVGGVPELVRAMMMMVRLVSWVECLLWLESVLSRSVLVLVRLLCAAAVIMSRLAWLTTCSYTGLDLLPLSLTNISWQHPSVMVRTVLMLLGLMCRLRVRVAGPSCSMLNWLWARRRMNCVRLVVRVSGSSNCLIRGSNLRRAVLRGFRLAC